MSRSINAEVLVLGVSVFGEGHKNADLLVNTTRDNSFPSILRATVFGGAKTKRQGGVEPFQTGNIWLYFNPVKQSYKVTDFSCKNIRSNISDSLIRIWCASFLSELTIRMHGNLDWTLVNAFLDGINRSTDTECKTALLRFMWRVLLFTGIAPELTNCCRCNRLLKDYKTIAYIPYENAVVCPNCMQNNESELLLSNEAIRYLETITNRPPNESRKFILSEQSFLQLRSFLYYQMTQLTGQPFKTLTDGIL